MWGLFLQLDARPMKVDVLLGLQWGDEGKGKIVDVLTPQYDIIARFQGGPNAGHTLEFDGRKHVLHTIPSGIFREGKLNLIGNGVVIDPVTLQREIGEVEEHGVDVESRLLISRKAHLIFPPIGCLMRPTNRKRARTRLARRYAVSVRPTWTRPVATDCVSATFSCRTLKSVMTAWSISMLGC